MTAAVTEGLAAAATAAGATDGATAQAALLARCRAHLLERIAATPVGSTPFAHAWIEQVFPPDFYEAVRAQMLGFKRGGQVQDRTQDNPAFTNRRYNLFAATDDVTATIRGLFDDPVVRMALLRKFYDAPTPALAQALSIHQEFEYFFTAAGRFQNIHVDIPPKFMSFVFYIPERPLTAQEEERNGTVLYDRQLAPHYPARFRANSLCVFVPHFYSYHGFSSTIDRDVLVMFYVNRDALRQWKALRKEDRDLAPFSGLRDAIEAKLRAWPLIEYAGEGRIEAERAACLVNAPAGRVLADGVTR